MDDEEDVEDDAEHKLGREDREEVPRAVARAQHRDADVAQVLQAVGEENEEVEAGVAGAAGEPLSQRQGRQRGQRAAQ